MSLYGEKISRKLNNLSKIITLLEEDGYELSSINTDLSLIKSMSGSYAYFKQCYSEGYIYGWIEDSLYRKITFFCDSYEDFSDFYFGSKELFSIIDEYSTSILKQLFCYKDKSFATCPQFVSSSFLQSNQACNVSIILDNKIPKIFAREKEDFSFSRKSIQDRDKKETEVITKLPNSYFPEYEVIDIAITAQRRKLE